MKQKNSFGKLSKKAGVHLNIMIAVAVVLIIIISLGIFFISKKQTDEITTVQQSLEIIELKFCNNVDDFFTCDENLDNTFEIGYSVYVYFIVKGFDEKDSIISYRQSLNVLDPNGKVVEPISIVWLEREEIYSDKITFYDEILTDSSDIPGTYDVSVIVLDKLSGKKATKNAKFKLYSLR